MASAGATTTRNLPGYDDSREPQGQQAREPADDSMALMEVDGTFLYCPPYSDEYLVLSSLTVLLSPCSISSDKINKRRKH